MDIKQAYREIMEALSDVMTLDPAGGGFMLTIKRTFHDGDKKPISGLFFMLPDMTICTISGKPKVTLTDGNILSEANYPLQPIASTTGGYITLDNFINLAMVDPETVPYIDMERAKRAAEEISKHYDRMNAATKAAEKKEVQEPCHLPALSSLPSTPMQQFLFRILNSGGELKKSTVTRSEQITIDEYMSGGIEYMKYKRKNRGQELTILFSDTSEIFTGRNKTFLKIFVFTCQKIAQQNNPRAVRFPLSELVTTGMYSSTDTARRAVNTFFQQQSHVQFFKYIKSKGQKSDDNGFLFYNRNIKNGYVTLSINENFPFIPIFAEQYTVFPRFAYSLGTNAFSLTHYIFTLARQNTKSLADGGTFNISMEAIRNYLGLPTVKELSASSRHYDLITGPIERAIEEIEEAALKAKDEYDGTLTITPYTVEGKGINEWLDGYITVGLSGEYAKAFTAIAGKQKELIAAYKKEKVKAAAQIAAKAEAKTGTRGRKKKAE